MAKKISRRQLRQHLIREHALLREAQELNEVWAALGRVVSNPALRSALSTAGTAALNLGKRAIGLGGKKGAQQVAKKTIGQKVKSLPGKAAMGGLKAYTAYSIGDMLFGGDETKAAEVQNMMQAAPQMQNMSPEGMQAVFGQDDPQQMFQVAQNVNQYNLHDAATLYGALKGLGTDVEIVRQAIQNRKGSLAQLYKEYARFISLNTDESNEPKEKDLLYWLEEDGEDELADMVRLELQA